MEWTDKLQFTQVDGKTGELSAGELLTRAYEQARDAGKAVDRVAADVAAIKSTAVAIQTAVSTIRTDVAALRNAGTADTAKLDAISTQADRILTALAGITTGPAAATADAVVDEITDRLKRGDDTPEGQA